MVAEAARRFEKFLRSAGDNVQFNFVEVMDDAKLIPELEAGHGDIAANLIVPPGREEPTVTLIPFMTGIREVIAVAPGQRPLASLEDLESRSVYVDGVSNTSHFDSLKRLNAQLEKINKPGCKIVPLGEGDIRSEELLLLRVGVGEIPATVVYSHVAEWPEWQKDPRNHAAINNDVAISQDIVLAWAVRKDSPKLAEQLTAFFKSERANPGR